MGKIVNKCNKRIYCIPCELEDQRQSPRTTRDVSQRTAVSTLASLAVASTPPHNLRTTGFRRSVMIDVAENLTKDAKPRPGSVWFPFLGSPA